LKLSALLDIRPGITAVIGGGGKTTLLRTLGAELARDHTVLLCTTTKILPFPGLPCAHTGKELDQLRKSARLLCAGVPVPDTEKLGPLDVSMAQLTGWFDYVLVEADGAARRPMKAHAPHEPVIPPEATQTILVVGASGFGQPISQAVHRPALYAQLAGAKETDPVTPDTEAAVILAEDLQDRLFINQVESEQNRENALALARLVGGPVVIGSLWKETYFSC
jgi:probable selenium-dependent hydroxylase accessory protein YqeC